MWKVPLKVFIHRHFLVECKRKGEYKRIHRATKWEKKVEMDERHFSALLLESIVTRLFDRGTVI